MSSCRHPPTLLLSFAVVSLGRSFLGGMPKRIRQPQVPLSRTVWSPAPTDPLGGGGADADLDPRPLPRTRACRSVCVCACTRTFGVRTCALAYLCLVLRLTRPYGPCGRRPPTPPPDSHLPDCPSLIRWMRLIVLACSAALAHGHKFSPTTTSSNHLSCAFVTLVPPFMGSHRSSLPRKAQLNLAFSLL